MFLFLLSVMCMIVCVNMCVRASIVRACTRYVCLQVLYAYCVLHPPFSYLTQYDCVSFYRYLERLRQVVHDPLVHTIPRFTVIQTFQ